MPDRLINSKNKVESAAGEALRVIATAATEATRVVAHAAAEAVKVLDAKGAIDHDLLIELKTRMEALKDDIKDLKDGTNVRIEDHEVRITSLENARTRTTILVSLGVGLLIIIATMLIYHLFGVKI